MSNLISRRLASYLAALAALGYVWKPEPALAQFTPGSSGGFVPAGMPPGVTNGSSAPAGQVGEVISSTLLSPNQITLTTGVITAVTTVNLTPGDWDVSGNIYFAFSAAGGSGQGCLISQAGQFTDPAVRTIFGAVAAAASVAGPVPTGQVNVSVTTTVYLNAIASFTSGTANAAGAIFARRAR